MACAEANRSAGGPDDCTGGRAKGLAELLELVPRTRECPSRPYFTARVPVHIFQAEEPK